MRRTLRVSLRDKISNKTIRERTGQEELGCIIIRKRLACFGHVTKMNKDKRIKQVMMTWAPRDKGVGKDQ